MVILVKNNKGGVGKSWISLQLAHTFAVCNQKVLILTSDSQNNILDFSGMRSDENIEFERTLDYHLGEGFKKWENWYVSSLVLRDNLTYMPLISASLGEQYAERFAEFVEDMKSFFDVIVIDATPVLGLDDCFIEVADKIVVPTYLDTVTTESIAALINSVGGSKISVVIPNRFNRTKNERELYAELKEFFMPTQTMLTVPMKQSSYIASLIDSGKTIWDVKSVKSAELKELFQKVVEELSKDEQ